MVGAEDSDQLLPRLKDLPKREDVEGLEAKVKSLQEKSNQLEYELQTEKADS